VDLQDVQRFLSRYRYGVVSSISEEGTPQSALVGIAITSELEVIFDTVKSSRKYANLIRKPSCSFVIGWEGEQTVQLEGAAVDPRGSDLSRYQEVYFSVWPDGRARTSWPGITYFVVHPHWIRYSDFDANPPLIQEFTL
jgi:hypothetical protein